MCPNEECDYSTQSNMIYNHTCENCGHNFQNNSTVYICPECKFVKTYMDYANRTYKIICKECGHKFECKNNNYNTCPECGFYNFYEIDMSNRIYKHVCEACGLDFISNGIAYRCPECSYYSLNGGFEFYSKLCENCGKETPCTENGECKICETKEFMWCKRCKRFGKISSHSNPEHGIHYKVYTRDWLINKPEEVKSINWFTNQDLEVSGVYALCVKNLCIYIGESKDIRNRLDDHLYNIFHYPDHFMYTKENRIEIRVLEETTDLMERQDYWINKLKPWSQKCNGTDHVKDLKDRENVVL